MTISAKIIADSISPAGIRLTTFQLRYPRFIHAEFMTHRLFSRNASSSRAIPVTKMIEDLRRDPAIPVSWGTNQKGMQAGEPLPDILKDQCIHEWLDAMHRAIQSAEALIDLGLHKQIANRILEPWGHINVVVTATDWENFYTLRRHEDAQPEIHALADAMWEAQQERKPCSLSPGQWHLPYVTSDDVNATYERIRGDGTENPHTNDHLVDQLMLKISVARCARVSYLTHDGRETTIEEDLQLYDRLLGAQPLHASPAEHQATPDTMSRYEHTLLTRDGDKEELLDSGDDWDNPKLHGNFTGWIQYRKTLDGEFVAG